MGKECLLRSAIKGMVEGRRKRGIRRICQLMDDVNIVKRHQEGGAGQRNIKKDYFEEAETRQ